MAMTGLFPMNYLYEAALYGVGPGGIVLEWEWVLFCRMECDPIGSDQRHQMICIVLWRRTRRHRVCSVVAPFWVISLQRSIWIGMWIHSLPPYSSDFSLLFPVGHLLICRVRIVDFE